MDGAAHHLVYADRGAASRERGALGVDISADAFSHLAVLNNEERGGGGDDGCQNEADSHQSIIGPVLCEIVPPSHCFGATGVAARRPYAGGSTCPLIPGMPRKTTHAISARMSRTIATITNGFLDRRLASKIDPPVGGATFGSVVARPQR